MRRVDDLYTKLILSGAITISDNGVKTLHIAKALAIPEARERFMKLTKHESSNIRTP